MMDLRPESFHSMNYKKDASFNETMDLFLLSLDVVMVWHAFY